MPRMRARTHTHICLVPADGNVYKVLEFLHVKPGKGSAFVRTKLKNLTRSALLNPKP
jgi:translation elongation factor P/translation initiation factor 5A